MNKWNFNQAFLLICYFCNLVSLQEIPAPDCFTKRQGVCIDNGYECPFEDRNEQKNNNQPDENICPVNMFCCIPPKSSDAFDYSKETPNCGILSHSHYKSQPVKRIRGGHRASLKQFPWQVSIMCGNKYICGGTLIHPNWVLTAAHCKTDSQCSDSNIHVIMGTVSLFQAKQTKKIKQFVSHPFYSNHVNDIGLIEMNDAVTLDEFTNIACLPNPKEQFNNIVCVTCGFGALETHGQISNNLMFIPMPIVSFEKCNKKWMTSDNYSIDKEKQICAGFDAGKRDTCSGDSGGPLLCRKKDRHGQERFVLAGVISFGEAICGKRDDSYTVFTKTAEFISWINLVTRKAFF